MSLVDDLRGLKPKRCAACLWQEQLSADERAAVWSALDAAKEQDISYTDVMRVCMTWGMPEMSPSSWRNHAQNHARQA